MKYDKLIDLLGKNGWFDLATLVQLSGERRQSLHVQISRWCKDGMLLPLRRGLYAFPDRYCLSKINATELANALYTPSYLSTYWALGYYGLIPEYVIEFTSITSRKTKMFKNAFGTFRYQHIKASAIFGYCPFKINNQKVMLAEPEKALLDLWYLEQGKWKADRMAEMRFQNFELLDMDKLYSYATRFKSPRLMQATDVFQKFVDTETEGVVEL